MFIRNSDHDLSSTESIKQNNDQILISETTDPLFQHFFLHCLEVSWHTETLQNPYIISNCNSVLQTQLGPLFFNVHPHVGRSKHE